MTQPASTADRLRQTFRLSARGVAGCVDDLLDLCGESLSGLHWEDGRCTVRTTGAVGTDSFEVPVPKSVFRAALARVAALCNEHEPDSVTPYRGQCELPLGGEPPAVFQVAFTNTPDEQRLELRRRAASTDEPSRFTVLLRDRRTVTVYGHSVAYVPGDAHPGDSGSYGVLSHVGGSDVLVALFPVSEVTGVFSGEVRKEDTAPEGV